ncbi:MAG: hypothetical protein C4319_07975 [Acidimicrobiia bacterium]
MGISSVSKVGTTPAEGRIRSVSLRNRLLAVVTVASLGSVLITGALLASFYSLSARREAIAELSRQTEALAEEVGRIVRTNEELRSPVMALAKRIPIRAILSSGKLDYVGVWFIDQGSQPTEVIGSEADKPTPEALEAIVSRIEAQRTDTSLRRSQFVTGDLETVSNRRLVFSARTVPNTEGRLLVIAARRVSLPSLRVLARLLVASIVGLGISGALAWWLSRRILDPVAEMEKAALGIAGGNYSVRVKPPKDRELARLAGAMNAMAEQVQAARQREQGLLMAVSHDLRTPLTSIRAYAEGIADGTIEGQEEIERAADVIASEAKRLSRLVDVLFDAARLGSGQLVLNVHEVDLADVVEDVASVFASRAENMGIELQTCCDRGAVVMTDGDRIAQVVSNLVDNALKNTPSGGRVVVGVERIGQEVMSSPAVGSGRVAGADPGQSPGVAGLSEATKSLQMGKPVYRLYVSDTGRGIPPNDIKRIFEPGFSSGRRTDGGPGLGLGLAIVKSIVSALGGSIEAASEEGKGTTISIYIS